MGLESINYQYYPEIACEKKIINLFINIGAIRNETMPNLFHQYVLKGKDYWIDIEFIPQNHRENFSISFRIALCNPSDVKNKLWEVFSLLFSTCKGYVIDRASQKKIFMIDASTIQMLEESFEQANMKFKQHFGNFAAAISGEKVFSYYREHILHE